MQEFYILSLSHTTADAPSPALWWRANDCGYTENLAQAGRYTVQQVQAKPDYYDNGRTTRAVPCVDADMVASRRIDGDVAVRTWKESPAVTPSAAAIRKEARK